MKHTFISQYVIADLVTLTMNIQIMVDVGERFYLEFDSVHTFGERSYLEIDSVHTFCIYATIPVPYRFNYGGLFCYVY